ncbi:hypothetical protein [Pseudomonas asplenii]|uniref:hypothetical protein n=1 Tax=Pseudomonas asplenii TaxID=53407 RepID=UPI0009B743D7|nr:hypothetical protein [Pseudomonas fuscovaginae]
MARREFAQFEAVSAAVRGEAGYHAAIAVKALGGFEPPRFHKILADQTFGTALEADQAAELELARLADVDTEGGLSW